ncbi:spore germination protein KA [Caldicoprobacter guelmensis]|uniref:spore germination protein n=1 Tax=Caldicoprobacter guelmensis TaxID=1170224 RepID=UPI00195AFF9F|nr:spore germination protein [Caldicoprobacter guelmensis]MBM7583147.1 spore germination protein KA [Caldicoprobacter guelmensis]
MLKVIKAVIDFFTYKPHSNINRGGYTHSRQRDQSFYNLGVHDDQQNNNERVDWQQILNRAKQEGSYFFQQNQEGNCKVSDAGGQLDNFSPTGTIKPTIIVKKRNRRNKNVISTQQTQIDEEDIDLIKNGMVALNIDVNMEYVKYRFSVPKNQDIVIREFNVAKRFKAFLVFVDGMMDKTVINQFVLPQLMDDGNFREFNQGDILDYIVRNVVSVYQVTKLREYDRIIPQILNGVTALFIDGCNEALLIESRGFEKRSIEAPRTENVIRGPQEGFTENLRTNLSLLRRIIKNEKLITEMLPVGDKNKINCALVYLEDTADPELVKEVKRRIRNIRHDFVESSGMLEQLIEDNPFMLFPQVISTERPDRAASFIMEGQVVIVCEGSPFVIAVPVTFFHLLHSSEDTMLRWQYGAFIRLTRFIGVLVAALVPGLWMALVQFHSEMIPTPLLLSILKMREAVPFPVVVEVLTMEVAFELIREGGIRVPGLIGQTLGIIGALILGQAAVAAGLVSPILIIIVAITGIGNFVIPNYSLAMAIRIVRFFFILMGTVLGFYGISVGLTILMVLTCSMKSFGVPFLTPFTPKTKRSSDLIVRKPLYEEVVTEDYMDAVNRESGVYPKKR